MSNDRSGLTEEEALRLAREHVAGHDADMDDEPECAKCHERLDSSNEPSAFCSACIYYVADVLAEQTISMHSRAAKLEAQSCPCHHTTPCSDLCTCANPLMSAGCSRCCTYGSPEQRKTAAEHISRLLATVANLMPGEGSE